MSLREYKRKRQFDKTPEPRQGRPEAALEFCGSKACRQHLHYDFRLEVDGVLKSWAVSQRAVARSMDVASPWKWKITD